MKFTKPLFFCILALTLASLACTLTESGKPGPTPPAGRAAMVAHAAPQLGPTTAPTDAPTPAPQVCKVKTRIEAGRLNLRACGDVSCPILATVNEGEALTQAQAGNGWLKVETEAGLTGWVNSTFTDCEAIK